MSEQFDEAGSCYTRFHDSLPKPIYTTYKPLYVVSVPYFSVSVNPGRLVVHKFGAEISSLGALGGALPPWKAGRVGDMSLDLLGTLSESGGAL